MRRLCGGGHQALVRRDIGLVGSQDAAAQIREDVRCLCRIEREFLLGRDLQLAQSSVRQRRGTRAPGFTAEKETRSTSSRICSPLPPSEAPRG
jgi:hypothetical protein